MTKTPRVLFTMLVVSFFLSLNIATATAGDLLGCMRECGDRLHECSEKTDIGTVCKGIEACEGLEAQQITITNEFCDDCAEGGEKCPSVTAPPPPSGAPPPAPRVASVPTPPLTPELRCRLRGGVIFEGECVTLADVKKDVEALKRDSATKEEVEALKKRLDALPPSRGSADGQDRALLDEWIRLQFESIGGTDKAQTGRLDKHDRELEKLKEEDGHGSLIGFQGNVFADIHIMKPNEQWHYAFGAEFRWLPSTHENVRLLAGVGAGFSGYSEEAEKLALLRLELGAMFHTDDHLLHASMGFMTDQVVNSRDWKDSSFYGGFVEPGICYPAPFTPCAAISVALGSTTFQDNVTNQLDSSFDVITGLSVGLAHLP